MTKRYIGGILSANMLNVSATGASGIWSPSMAAGYRAGFKWPGTLITTEYFAIGGGSGATGGVSSVNYGSGGAAGVVRTGTSYFVPGATYTITVGSGGAGSNGIPSGAGGSSIISGTGISTITATGGNSASTGFTGASNADYSGAANGGGSQYVAGGGAGSAGNATHDNGGAATALTWTGTTLYFGGGGVGGGGSGIPGTGGGAFFGAGATNTGSGGGGAGSDTGGGAGGSGCVFIRVPDTLSVATTTGVPTITTSGGYRIYKFTASGTITF